MSLASRRVEAEEEVERGFVEGAEVEEERLNKLATEPKKDLLSPASTRKSGKESGWDKIVGSSMDDDAVDAFEERKARSDATTATMTIKITLGIVIPLLLDRF